jgi:short-subunit dehydrogenase
MDVTRLILPHFHANKHGGIINVSSGAGFWSLPMFSMYSASKFALEGFTESLSYKLASQNIFVKSVVPHGGVTSTYFFHHFSVSTAVDKSLTSYNDFMAATGASFSKMIAGAGVSSRDVAQMIYEAATDGSRQLRYFMGNDMRGFLKARYETSSDEEYMKWMHLYFD